jgi:RND family efflux transporter MFP subunit
MKELRIAIQVVIILVVLGLAGAIAYHFIITRPKAKKADVITRAPLVEVIEPACKTHEITVSAMGTVQSGRELIVKPEVVGAVLSLSPKLVLGGLFQEGDTLVQIDRRDYELMVTREKAIVSTREADVALEAGRRIVAKREWEALKESASADDLSSSALALREPQYQTAKARLEEAKAGHRRAEINLERTTIKVPFNAFVKQESVEIGQLVNPQTVLATLVGTDKFKVIVSVPLEQLQHISIPGRNIAAGAAGSSCDVIQKAGATQEIRRKGRVTRLLGEMELVGRMARLVVEVEDPLALKDKSQWPLLIGAYVRVKIMGRSMADVCAVPRRALRDGSQVWICDSNNLLVRRAVDVVWREKDRVFVRKGIEKGDRIIVSRLANPVPGMALRISDMKE